MVRWRGWLAGAAGAVVLVLGGVAATPASVSAAPALPAHVFAPYFGTWASTPLQQLASGSGVKHFTLAFILGGGRGCQATWNGSTPIAAGDALSSQIRSLQASGGDVIVSFGGANGPYLEQFCRTPASLEAQYQAVVDTYHVSHIDFDIEAMWDQATLDLRSRAIAMLQKARGTDVSLTLPVLQSGLTQFGVAAVRSAASHGARISVVNIMTMDYGGAVANMGQAAIQAANSLFGQLKPIFPGRSAAQLWAMEGNTPMIGRNDSAGETFTEANARALLAFAKQKGIGRLSMWQVSRDNPCPNGGVSGTCSGVGGKKWDFSHILNG
jgi:Glycosyl hydrolases family 18